MKDMGKVSELTGWGKRMGGSVREKTNLEAEFFAK